jgi:hypothetical protein
MEPRYFKDIDTDVVYACVGSMGINGMFRLRQLPAGNSQWEFLVPNSPAWDWVHQRIYRNARVEEVRPDEFPAPLPTIPEIPSGPFPDWRSYFLPQQPIHASAYPRAAEFLKAQKDGMAAVFIVLSEDVYETTLGDGEFHDFDQVSLTEEDAQRHIDQNRSRWNRLHLRTMTIRLDHEVFVFPDFNPELFDRYSAEEVLRALETLLQA